MVGLGNVDNTSDANKPVSTATQTALNLKANLLNPTFSGTVSGINASMVGLGNVTNNAQLPLSGGTMTGLLSSIRLTEQLVSTSHSSNVYTLNYNNGSIFFSTNAPTANFTVNITNIPTGGTNNQYTITLLYQASFFGNTASATDTSSATIVSSSTPKYIGGTAPSITTNSMVIQTFTVVQCFATKYILTNAVIYN